MSRGSDEPSRRGVLAAAGAAILAWPAHGQEAMPPGPEDWPFIDPEVLELLPNQMTRMTVQVRLNGEGPYDFVVDTGANRTSISREIADALNLEPGPTVLVHGVTSAELAQTVHIPSLTLGSSRFRNLHTPVFPVAQLGAQGLLGVDVLRDFRLEFDVERSRISMAQSARTSIRRTHRATRLRPTGVLGARQRFGQLTVVDVWVDDVQVLAFVDTGSQYTVGNRALFEAIGARRPSLREQALSVPIIGVTGQLGRGEIAVARSLRLGQGLLLDTPVIFANLHAFDVWGLAERPALLLGADVIGRLRHVVLDFGLGEMEFGPVIHLRPQRGPPAG